MGNESRCFFYPGELHLIFQWWREGWDEMWTRLDQFVLWVNKESLYHSQKTLHPIWWSTCERLWFRRPTKISFPLHNQRGLRHMKNQSSVSQPTFNNTKKKRNIRWLTYQQGVHSNFRENKILCCPCKNYDTDFLMSFWRQFGWKWHQIRWKSHHFLSKCHGNSMTWTCPKSMSCLGMGNK